MKLKVGFCHWRQGTLTSLFLSFAHFLLVSFGALSGLRLVVTNELQLDWLDEKLQFAWHLQQWRWMRTANSARQEEPRRRMGPG